MPNINTTSQIGRITVATVTAATGFVAVANDWDGYDISVANGETVRVIPDDTAIRVLRFSSVMALMGEANFSGDMPESAIVSCILATAAASA